MIKGCNNNGKPSAIGKGHLKIQLSPITSIVISNVGRPDKRSCSEDLTYSFSYVV